MYFITLTTANTKNCICLKHLTLSINQSKKLRSRNSKTSVYIIIIEVLVISIAKILVNGKPKLTEKNSSIKIISEFFDQLLVRRFKSSAENLVNSICRILHIILMTKQNL